MQCQALMQFSPSLLLMLHLLQLLLRSYLAIAMQEASPQPAPVQQSTVMSCKQLQ